MPPAAAGGVEDPATRVAIVVSSCDRFFDAWRPFAAFWRRYWPAADLPWPVFLIVNWIPVHSPWLTPLAVGRDRGWADNLRLALGRIDADYVLYLQEDYFLTAVPDVAQLATLVAAMRAGDADLLCLREMPPGHGAELWPAAQGGRVAGVSEIPPESPWRGRLQAAFWRRSALLNALRPGESAWDFEARAAERLRPLRAWTVTGGTRAAGALPYLSSAIVRGLWTPEARRLCLAHGIDLDPACRGTFSENKGLCRRRRALDRLRLPLARAWERLARRPMEL